MYEFQASSLRRCFGEEIGGGDALLRNKIETEITEIPTDTPVRPNFSDIRDKLMIWLLERIALAPSQCRVSSATPNVSR